jgi:hypothetical protein
VLSLLSCAQSPIPLLNNILLNKKYIEEENGNQKVLWGEKIKTLPNQTFRMMLK